MKIFEIHYYDGRLLGYVKADNDTNAFDKVMNHYSGCCSDNYYIEEINENEMIKGEMVL